MEKRLKVLVSNDSVEFQQECGQVLEDSGMELIYTQKDGVKLLEKIEAIHPDVVLADLFMPRLDGIGVMHAADKLGHQKPLFVIISNFTSPTLEREVMTSGAAYFAVSPFNASELAERIVQIVGLTEGALQPESEPSLEIQVTEILHQIGVPAHIKGYQFLRAAILLTISDHGYINAVTKRLYPEIAKRNMTTASRVERAIRHAIEVAWDRGDVDTLNSYFGYTIHNLRGKPTNSEFIAMISDKIRLDKKRHA